MKETRHKTVISLLLIIANTKIMSASNFGQKKVPEYTRNMVFLIYIYNLEATEVKQKYSSSLI